MSAPSPVALCNRALTQVGGRLITSFADDNNEAKLCALHYEPLRDEVTTAYEWSHALARFGPMTPLAGAPPFGYDYTYQLPSGCLRVLHVTIDPDGEHEVARYAVEGQQLLADIGAGLYLRYIQRVTDTTKFTSMFTQALVARIAAELSVPLAESKSLAQQNFQLYQAKVGEAASVDGLQGRATRITVTRHRAARHRG